MADFGRRTGHSGDSGGGCHAPGKNGKEQGKISVIVENSDDYQWSAFRYGVEMAARDEDVEVFVVNVSGSLTAKEQEN